MSTMSYSTPGACLPPKASNVHGHNCLNGSAVLSQSLHHLAAYVTAGARYHN